MFLVVSVAILFSFKATKFFEFVSVHRAFKPLTIFIMPAVITEKSPHVINQSQRFYRR